MSSKLFLSKFVNKLDKKFRISIPAAYRNILTVENSNNLIIYPSIKNNCIECCHAHYLEILFNKIKQIDLFSKERDAFETVLLGSAYELTIDGDGRITLPSLFVQNFSLKDTAIFIGKGEIFEIWNPLLLEEYIKASQELVKKHLLKIK